LSEPLPIAAPSPPNSAPVLEVEDLHVRYLTRAGAVEAVRGVDFTVPVGGSFGLVGESGCGKSTIALAVMRYLGRNGEISGGRIRIEGRDLAALTEAELLALRGGRVAMVYQEPMSSLNPVLTVGRQLTEVVRLHGGIGDEAARARAVEMLGLVQMPEPAKLLDAYPHQLSGGMQQRVVIAMALMASPALLVLDEPTTALDVRVQAGILDLIADLRDEVGAAILYISHDLGTVARICDRVAVMRHGEIVEQGPVEEVFRRPRHDYTRSLLAAVPTLDDPVTARPPDAGERALDVIEVSKVFGGDAGPMRRAGREIRALDNVSLHVPPGRTLAIVGESGSGKSTLARILLGLETADGGRIELRGGLELAALDVGRRPKEVLSRLQMVFQNPDATLNPSHSVGYAIARPLRRLGRARGDARAHVARLLAAVGLCPEFARRKPHQLSGGQKQRVGIARALASSPEIVVADEPTSALDVSVRARVVELLGKLQGDRGLTIVFISHDLALVRSIADLVAVIHEGRIVEFGPVEEVFSPPHHPYTEELISAVPDVARALAAE
jgi:ABC-type glutathione transport system ATPase component